MEVIHCITSILIVIITIKGREKYSIPIGNRQQIFPNKIYLFKCNFDETLIVGNRNRADTLAPALSNNIGNTRLSLQIYSLLSI
jgi:hypothetical protein